LELRKKKWKVSYLKPQNIFQKYLELETDFKILRTSEHLKASSFGVCSVITGAVRGAAQ
jgi:hypothetical protein